MSLGNVRSFRNFPFVEDHNTTTIGYLRQQHSPEPLRSSKRPIAILQQRDVELPPWDVPQKTIRTNRNLQLSTSGEHCMGVDGKTVSELTTTTTKSNTHIQVQMKPIRMEYQINDNVCNTTALTVYAQIEYLAEVKGACIRITHDKTSHSQKTC